MITRNVFVKCELEDFEYGWGQIRPHNFGNANLPVHVPVSGRTPSKHARSAPWNLRERYRKNTVNPVLTQYYDGEGLFAASRVGYPTYKGAHH